jgi:hypothetical protein
MEVTHGCKDIQDSLENEYRTGCLSYIVIHLESNKQVISVRALHSSNHQMAVDLG